ncbi:MAG: 3-deoxy-8-phosphooctulonate synthase [Ignavibacteriales bacterium]|nr:3-deoxy-8-phosphooctulonate synthase [Ignavibacteriales bacterium]
MKVKNIEIDNKLPFVLMAGPCVVENEEITFQTARKIKEITSKLNIPFIFKASYKKANRTNKDSFTTLGVDEAINILHIIKRELDVPILTDIHKEEEATKAADVADILQIPAFLCRQTDILIAAAKTKKVVNIKKGQFLAPEDMKNVIQKIEDINNKIVLTERGTTFGYHNLVVDMRSIEIMKELEYPVIMDATHSVQLPSAGNTSGGQPKFIKPLAKAATAIGIAGLFLEVHPEPKKALSDAASQLPLDQLENLLIEIKKIDEVAKSL